MATRSNMGDEGLVKESAYSNVYRVVSFLWGFLWSRLFPMFGSIFRLILRFQVPKNSEKSLSNSDLVYHEEKDHQIGSHGSVSTSVDGGNGEKEIFSYASSSKYEFLSGKGISGFLAEPKTIDFTVHEVTDGSGDDGIISCPIVNKEGSLEGPELEAEDSVEEKTDETGEFMERSVFGEVLKGEEPENSTDGKISDVGVSTNEESLRNESDSEAGVTGHTEEESLSSSAVEEDLEKHEPETFTRKDSSRREEDIEIDQTVPANKDSREIELEAENPIPREIFINEVPKNVEQGTFTSERIVENEEVLGRETTYDFYFVHDEKEESVGSNDDCPRSSDKIDIFAPQRTSTEGFHPRSPIFADEDDQDRESIFMQSNFSDSDDDYIEFQPRSPYSVCSEDEFWSERVVVHEEEEPETDHLDKSEERVWREEDLHHNTNVQHDYSDLDFVYEHQDIIEQLKMEMMNARTGGLPTIQEESETEESWRTPPPVVQELKPLKIEERQFDHKDCIDEIQKLYRSYSDKMRKLDVLNHQTMHALGERMINHLNDMKPLHNSRVPNFVFVIISSHLNDQSLRFNHVPCFPELLQMRDSFQSHTFQKYSVPAMKSLLFHNLFSCKQVANVVDPSRKVVADMHRDFETAYVGQLCLSWEILHWQYRKAQELQTKESQGSHHYYHQVAGEFQYFQALIHRFMENEPFQGPRVENYVKSRSVLRNLLQVPVIKDDNVKGKRGAGEDAITIQMLTEVIEQSMRVFWEFHRSDKDDPNAFVHQQTPVSLPDIEDLELFMDVKSDHQKKEKKLKDILRSRHCIVKKFQKHQGEGTHLLLMVAQVELRLVWRVLNMSKITTDQLIWCHEKLDKIKLCNRRVFVEPLFLLFPC